jgi:hypothetical protein
MPGPMPADPKTVPGPGDFARLPDTLGKKNRKSLRESPPA